MVSVIAVLLVSIIFALVVEAAVERLVNTTAQSNADPSELGDVIGLTIIHRHGARNPDLLVRPYTDEKKYWPEGVGELTKTGIIQHCLQGEWIAQRYKQLIPEFSNIHKAIRVVSTDWNRTIMSAEAELACMFAIHDDVDSWRGLRSYLVPIHTIPESDDALLEVTKRCPRLEALLKENINSERYQRIMKEKSKVADTIKKKLGYEIVNLDSYQQIHSVLSIQEERGYKLGKWVDSVYPQPLEYLARTSFAAPTWTTELKRLRGGPLIKQVIANVKRKAANPNVEDIIIYSAHDTTISAFLNSMHDMFEKAKLPPPKFGAVVIMEHWKIAENHFVRILYRCPYSKEESPDCHTEPRVLTIPGCSALCPLEQMEELLCDVIPQDWEKECGNRETHCCSEEDEKRKANSPAHCAHQPECQNIY